MQHHGGCPHCPAGARRDRLRGGRIVLFGEHGYVTADIGQRRLSQQPTGGGGVDAERPQHVARQMPPGIFGEVAKYIGEL